MAAPNNKGNFKTYEGQARLLRAMVAAHPEVKWNCKELAKHYGSDLTVFSMEHRMRDIKAQAKLIASAAKADVDCREIPVDLPKTEKEIAKMYGASTADGIQWQFRSIKKDANDLRIAANNGGDPASALNFGTPKGRAAGVKGTPASKRTAAGTRSTGSKRQKTSKFVEDEIANDDDDDDDDDNIDFDALSTPSKIRVKEEAKPSPGIPPPSLFGRPSRAATSAAADAIKSQSIDLTSDEEVKTPPSIFAAPPSDSKAIMPAGAPASSAQPDVADDDGANFTNEDWAGLFHQRDFAGNVNLYNDDLDGEI